MHGLAPVGGGPPGALGGGIAQRSGMSVWVVGPRLIVAPRLSRQGVAPPNKRMHATADQQVSHR